MECFLQPRFVILQGSTAKQMLKVVGNDTGNFFCATNENALVESVLAFNVNSATRV